jgi:hypothetical protein
MPSYDVECAACGFAGIETMKMAELDAWESTKKCPECACATNEFRRVIKFAPTVQGSKSTARSNISQKKDAKEKFVKSGKKDDMKHEQAKRHNPDTAAQAREIVKRGTYEGF